MSDQEEPKYELLPTGKPHISFSELRDWKECSFRHKLKHVKKIDLGKPGAAMDFGTAVHASCEKYLSTLVMDPEIAIDYLKEAWATHSFPPADLPKAILEAHSILSDVPTWLDKEFPNWEYIDAEHQLYESVEGYPHAFKGFIDGVIKTKGKRGEDLVWLLDWKTTGWGWAKEKKADPLVRSQLVLYKNYWSSKTGTNPKNVRCGFVLLKRSAKPGKHCELIPVSVGDVTTKRTLKVVNNMLSSVKRGIALKDRGSCKFCDYYNTEHCT